MLSHHRLFPALRPCLRSISRPVASTSSRSIASSLPRRDEPTPEAQAAPPEADLEFEETMGPSQSEGSDNPTSYREFMEKLGHKYKYAEPQHWLGDKAPFPMNPSFKPPPPISDIQRETMYQLYRTNRGEYGVRRLAKRMNISLKRVDAILRLKGLEKAWKQGKELQTGFQVGMEKLLGAQTHSSISQLEHVLDENQMRLDKFFKKPLSDPNSIESTSFRLPDVNAERSDVHQADILEEAEKRDAARYRYERLYWESVPEDDREPILPTILQNVKQRAELKKLSDEIKVNEKYMKRLPETRFTKQPPRRVFLRSRGSRPSTMFVDVGAQFMDVDDRIKRLAISQHKAKIRMQKLEKTTSKQ